ncbi:class I SAM-dependent RNA methyltransferase [Coprothermobacteraceae bacterium]|nr:class I SAM-dependent RNA methyltransferase [Coprothermobacteraceae bacterium]
MEFELTIEDLTPEGVGVARSNGVVFFVRGLVTVGDKVLAEVTRQKKSVTEANLISLLTPSPHRTEPRCKHYGKCGGCQLQHADYELQLQWKSRFVLQAMRRIAKVPLGQVEIVHADKAYEYRAKAHFAFVTTEEGLSIGYFDASNNWFAIQECPILEPHVLSCAFEVSKILSAHSLKSHFDGGLGTLRHLQVRVSKATAQVQVLITLTEPPHSLDSLANEILQSGVDSLAFHINRSKRRTVVGDGPTWVYGEKSVVERLLGARYLLSPCRSFKLIPRKPKSYSQLLSTTWSQARVM